MGTKGICSAWITPHYTGTILTARLRECPAKPREDWITMNGSKNPQVSGYSLLADVRRGNQLLDEVVQTHLPLLDESCRRTETSDQRAANHAGPAAYATAWRLIHIHPHLNIHPSIHLLLLHVTQTSDCFSTVIKLNKEKHFLI